MRLDYEAAEKAYRANIAEQDRQSQLGAGDKTHAPTSTATGTIYDLCSKSCAIFVTRTGKLKGPLQSAALHQMPDGRRINFN